MNKKLAQLIVIKSADYNGKLVKAIEDALVHFKLINQDQIAA